MKLATFISTLLVGLALAFGTGDANAGGRGTAAAFGQSPNVRLHGVPQGLSAVFREGAQRCERVAEPGRLAIWDEGHKLVIASSDICSELWRREGHIPGFVAQIATLREEGAVVSIVSNGDNATAGYRVVAQAAGRRATGWLVIDRQRFWHYERIYEGTDAFVNFCIDRNREIRSHDGRLYCTRESPVTGPSFIEFHRH